MNNQLKTELKKPLVKYGLILTAVLVLIQNALLPWLEWRGEMSDTLVVKYGFAIDRSELESAMQGISTRKTELKGDLEKLKSSFIRQGNSKVELPTKVRNICESFEIKVNRVSVTELENKYKGIDSYMVSLEAEGTVDKLFRLVEKLETDAAFFIVDRMTIYSRRGQTMKVRMELQKHVERK